MKISDLYVRNFKSIHDMRIQDIENALILVGQNNTGKTTVLDAIRAVCGEYQICPEDFGENGANIEITVSLKFTQKDLDLLRKMESSVNTAKRMPGCRISVKGSLPGLIIR